MAKDISDASRNGEGRAKALEGALATIERSFGKGAVMRLGDRTAMNVEVVSTGSLGLDIALGIGGLPRGRIIEIYGPESSGKCLTADTHTIGSLGLLSIEELFRISGHPTCVTNKIVPHSVGLLNEKSVIEQTSHLTWNGRKPVYNFVTSIGSVLSPTFNHPVRVMDENGFIVWRNAGNVSVGDHVVIMRGTECFPETDMVNPDEATLLGFLIADGANKCENRVAFSNSDVDVVEEYKRLIRKYAGNLEIHSYEKEETKTVDHHVNSKEFRTYLYDRLGLEYHLSAEKQVPVTVRRSGRDVQIAFLRAYFELECSIDPEKRGIEVSSASRRLLEQVQLMLLNIGFVGVISEKPVGDTMYWRLTYSGVEGYNLANVLGFRSKARLQMISAIAKETDGSTNIDSIPHLGRILRSLYQSFDVRNREADRLLADYSGDNPKAKVTYERLNKIIDFFESFVGKDGHPLLTHLCDLRDKKFFFSPVVSIGKGIEPTFDVCLPETHSFWSNGIISHNTTLTLHVIAEAQKLGGTCAFIDAEHALDPRYAKKLGVDVDNLLISQPDGGEQALEIADTLVRSGAIDVLVVDSVAALVPKAELEGDMGDSHVGLHARLMSQALRKLTGTVSRSKTIVIFINQIRLKIGVMFGNPETTTGGNALKFYSSVRLDIRRTGSIKDKDEAVGNHTRVKVVKNKMAPPFRQVEFDIMYGEGVSKTGELIDLGVKIGIVEKSGAWFSYDSQRIGQGRENAKKFLVDHPDTADEIEQRIRAGVGSVNLFDSSPE